MTQDDKYIVFKRDEYAHALGQLDLDVEAVEDAVVIRTKDRFARSALNSYVDSLLLYLDMAEDLEVEVDKATRTQLLNVADYIRDRADEAGSTLPD